MAGALWSMGFYLYTSDDTNNYTVGLKQEVALRGGFGTSTAGIINYPRGWVMRHFYGASSANGRCKVPAGVPGLSLFVSGGTFTLNTISYIVEGRIGEKRRAKV